MRRCATVPLYLLLACLLVCGAPVWFFAAALADVALGQSKRGRWPRVRGIAFFTLYFVAEAVGIVAATLLFAATIGGRVGGQARYIQANAALQRGWTEAIFRGTFAVYSMDLRVEGAEHVLPAPFVAMVRHSSTADTLLTAAVVANPHRLVLRYVVKQELLWDPCIDIVGGRLPNAFVDRKAPKETQARASVAALTRGLDAQSGVLIYPEGTRFSTKKLAKGLTRLQEGGATELLSIASAYRHVLPPRVGGVKALLKAAPQCDVLVVNHIGFDGATSFREFWQGGLIGRVVRVKIQRVPAADVPSDAPDRWLYETWRSVDDWLASQQSETLPSGNEHSGLQRGDTDLHPIHPLSP